MPWQISLPGGYLTCHKCKMPFNGILKEETYWFVLGHKSSMTVIKFRLEEMLKVSLFSFQDYKFRVEEILEVSLFNFQDFKKKIIFIQHVQDEE